MSKYDATYFVGDNQAINRVRVGSSRTSNRGAFSGSFAALFITCLMFRLHSKPPYFVNINDIQENIPYLTLLGGQDFIRIIKYHNNKSHKNEECKTTGN